MDGREAGPGADDTVKRDTLQIGVLLLLGAVVIGAHSILIPPAWAQATPPAPVETVAVADLEAKLKNVQESTGLDEATRTRLTELYTSALEQLRIRDEWAQKTAEFERARLEAPELLKRIEAELGEPPQPPTTTLADEAALADLEAALAAAEAKLEASRTARADLEQEPGRRAERSKKLPELLALIDQRLSEARDQLDIPAATGEPAEVTEARRALSRARVLAIEAEQGACKQELLSYDARGRLLPLRQDRAARDVSQSDKLVKLLRDRVAAARQAETQQAAAQASEAILRASQASPEVRALADLEALAAENAELVQERTGAAGLAGKIADANGEQGRLDEKLAKVQSEFTSIKAKVDAAGLNNVIGLLLRNSRRDMPDPRGHRRNIRTRNEKLAKAQSRQIELQDKRAARADVESLIEQALDGLAPTVAEDQRAEIASLLRDLLNGQRVYLGDLVGDYRSYVDLLLKLQLREQQLVDVLEEFSAYVDEHVLWVRSGAALGLSDLGESWLAARWLLDAQNWVQTAAALGKDAAEHAVAYGLALVAWLGLLMARRRAVKRTEQIATLASKPTCRSFRATAEALLDAVLCSVCLPAVLAFAAWRLGAARLGGDFEHALSAGLLGMAIVAVSFGFPRAVLRADGLAQAHFGWPAVPMRVLRNRLFWALLVGLPAVFLTSTLEWPLDERKGESLGRVAFVVAMVGFAVIARQLLHPKRGVLPQAMRAAGGPSETRLYDLLYIAALAGLLALAGMACVGYFYTALRLSWRIHSTVVFGFLMLVLRGLVLRWLLLARRRLSIEQGRKARELRRAQHAGEAPGDEEPEIDLVQVDAQSQRLLRSLLLFGFLAGLWMIWADVLPALGFLERVELWQTTQVVRETIPAADGTPVTSAREVATPITLAHLTLAVLIGCLTVIVVRNLPGILEIGLLQRLPLAKGERYAVTTVIRYAIMLIGALLVFNAIGVGWGKVQWLVAAMGVGLGFGLQEIFANFVSGIIILFERPIRLGDTVTIGGIHGTVSQIRMRATRITDWDRKELIVPNKEFVTGQLVNWTLSDSILRLIVPVGIAYGSDTERAVQVLREVARDHLLVLDDPEPKVLFMAFGSSSLDFELRAFCPDIESFLQLRHELHMAIDKRFREAGIEIAFPQQDVHVRSIEDALPIVDRRERGPDRDE